MSTAMNEKVAVYLKIINLFVEFFSAGDVAADTTNNNPNYLRKTFIEIGTHIFVFGSDEVVEKYLDFRRHAIEATAKGRANIETVKVIANLMLAMRKELVDIDTKIERHDFLKMIMNDWDIVKSL